MIRDSILAHKYNLRVNRNSDIWFLDGSCFEHTMPATIGSAIWFVGYFYLTNIMLESIIIQTYGFCMTIGLKKLNCQKMFQETEEVVKQMTLEKIKSILGNEYYKKFLREETFD